MNVVRGARGPGLLGTRRGRLLLLALLVCLVPVAWRVTTLFLWTVPVIRGRLPAVLNPNSTRGLAYFHEVVREVPWSIHVLKLRRARRDWELHSALGGGTRLGMTTVPEQLRALPPEWGKPVAAVNGDLYNDHPAYPGDPEGLQIVQGELVSGPSPTRVCFWLDPEGNPCSGDVRSRFEVTWPDGSATPFGLNEARLEGAAVLYTSVVGASTRAPGGIELELEPGDEGPWLPLRIGQAYTARVRSLNPSGNSPLTRESLVLSLSPELLNRVPPVQAGMRLRLSTATNPALSGITTAIGGGPTLVENSKAKAWSGIRLRHPRTAIGWNHEHLFLVVVDGRQLRVSAGMTFPELADYLVKLGCETALALDGGGSATCWAYGQVMNNPSQGRERPAANSLVVIHPPRGTP